MNNPPAASDGSCMPDLGASGPKPIHWTESTARQLQTPATHPDLLGRLGRYDVERLIGSGGMGVVFKAFDTELSRPVAIKLLAPYLASSAPSRKRFAREARAAAAVVHQHVVPIHNVETDRDAPFIVMQFVSGISQQERIDRAGPLELCEILRIGMQVAEGLAAAHRQGLVHRDIKPSNILLEEGVDRALISDFGLARAADDATLTGAGFHPGTPQYMSPEQASGHSVDARSDLFSLGSMLYTMCTGRPPFRAEHTLGVLRRIADSEPRPICEINPRIPDWLERLVGRLMAKPAGERPPSAAVVASLLQRCLAHIEQPHSVALPHELSSPSTMSPQRQRRRLLLWISATAVTAGLVWAGTGVLWHELVPADSASQISPAGQANPPSLPAAGTPGTSGTENSVSQRDETPPDVNLRSLLETGRSTATMPEGLVVRIATWPGLPQEPALPEARELAELWEFTPNLVHRVQRFFTAGRPAYGRIESREFDSSRLCQDLWEARIAELQDRQGTGRALERADPVARHGSRSIQLEWNGHTVLDLQESAGPTRDADRGAEAKAFGTLYERLATQARMLLGPQVGEISRLQWQRSGVLDKVGAVQPWGIDLSREKPAGLKSEPVGLISPRYGAACMGPPECAASMFVIVDSPAGHPATLYVDCNADGQMADETGHGFTPKPVQFADGSERTRYVVELSIEIPFPEGHRPASLTLFRLDPRFYPGAYESDLLHFGDFGYAGTTRINGRSVPTVVLDMGCTGETRMNGHWKSVPRIWFDFNADGARDPQEVVQGGPFAFDGKWWQVTMVGYDGTIRVVPSQPLPPEPEPVDLSPGLLAPKFTTTATAGKTVNFPGDFRGKIVLLDFWATWCGPCVAEIPHIRELHQTYHERGLIVLGISDDGEGDLAKLKEFTASRAMSWQQIIGYKKSEPIPIAKQFGIGSIPYTLLVDGDTGIILANDLKGTALDSAIQDALERKARNE